MKSRAQSTLQWRSFHQRSLAYHLYISHLLYAENEVKSERQWNLKCAIKSQVKKDHMLDYKIQRIPFLEEKVRKIRGGGKLSTMDIHRLLLSEDNRFDFVDKVAAEAKQYVENNRDEYGTKKVILHILSNRMNDAGFYRPEAYMESDPFKPGPGYLKEEL
ncbi:Hypothetical predicted protein [Olea europaea subsp. europaea]|uniref:Protein PLASTID TRANSCRIPTIONALLY ACTIVE 7 n=1 Tax=Olea europaea subsp. europaea TaxID=158383 RepID=A0A8S0PJA4_OLEEU|nr:Hypothetical predicted protein [Olea europaea subsp. europaea]